MTTKAAMLVGIDDYPRAPLGACVRDVEALAPLLARNDDGSLNFDCMTLKAPRGGLGAKITRASLRERIDRLFSKRLGLALFYFGGHGMVTSRGGFLMTQDEEAHDEGVNMEEVLHMANRPGGADEVIIILDCCYAGRIGMVEGWREPRVELREGVCVMAATSPWEPAVERRGRGVFSSLVGLGLEGGAADVLGQVTPASLYAYVDQALGGWDQRPMFKANLSHLTPLRSCQPQLPLEVLQRLVEYFPEADAVHPLDPSYEPDDAHKPPGVNADPVKVEIFGHLQRLRSSHLLVPVGEEHLYWAAIRGKGCRLTPLGRHFWRLVKENRL